ncbi:f245f34f-83f5-4bd4-b364-22c0b6a216e6 [Sclerotinia trifoliorum]|uniref:F245f34f-83f5-4bd4-b364-22c0b6a216e6 n=1 Tax=Sclerotinia trifoliorum TaxID=28548 RepID=A0A8H2VVA5_9HELO|nr:f245f34f-83f5-4bd4-b364-22c0b6a216e6 [Sclerotinia trifoliorum]
MSNKRSDHLNLGHLPQPAVGFPRSGSSTSNTSPTEASIGGAPLRSPFGLPLNSAGKMASNTRSGAGSPSHELATQQSANRLFPTKRAREIQAQEGGFSNSNVWGPPTSGNSTPLRETILESPTDGFPDFAQLPTVETTPARRARAGTLPSRFSSGGPLNTGPGSLAAKTSRPTPSSTPFKSPSPNLNDLGDPSTSTGLLNRLRSGSTPQNPQYKSSPFGHSGLFTSSWGLPSGGRDRTSTLQSIASQSSNGPSSPAQSSFSREGNNDNEIRTLDYLGLAETPQPPRAQLVNPLFANILDINRQSNRFRSYSVNAKEKYAEDEEDDDYGSGSMTPYEQAQAAQQVQLQMQMAATNAAIQQHNLAVQHYASQANRPRARTAGVLDSPNPSRLLRDYYPSASRLGNTITASELREAEEFAALPEAVAAMTLGRSNSRNEHLSPNDNLEGPTSALWLGSIPSSTTTSTLTEMFKIHGPVQSARVLTHKNCGFVNFEHVDSAITAKALMHGKEIFPGAGPVRINFAKPVSPATTPGPDGAFPSPSPDPFSKGLDSGANATDTNGAPGVISRPETTEPPSPRLRDIKNDILNIVSEFGATAEDKVKIGQSLQSSISYDKWQSEIPAIPEPSHSRVHDAPKLRDIRKRIDNQSWSPAEIEAIAMEMLEEVAELSSDYLGNTVVQKLFEHCSDDTRDLMLERIAPHMAEIGVHKNGTWAAQKIIDVCKTPKQMTMIVQNLAPYTVPLFLDQYGNYVLQCCLKFGSPYNDFIFEAMLSKMKPISEGRYGARAMRACLESHHSTKDQQRMLAAAIALHSVQLATNANGALLLTWFLDTCTFPQRRSVLAPQLVPNLVHLCKHKVAYLTVLKVINQKLESDARDQIFQALFFSKDDETLEAILSDQACGATLIFKVLTTPFFDESIRSKVVENVRNVLLRLKAQPAQGYKRLMDEVGLSTRNGSAGPSREHSQQQTTDRPRPGSQQSQAIGQHAPQSQYGANQYYPQMQQNPQIQQNAYDMSMNMQRTDSMDSNVTPYQQYALPNSMFPQSTGMMQPMNMQQLQYQNMARGTPPINSFYPAMQSGFGAFGTPQMTDQYRGMQNASPIQPPSQQMSPSPMVGQNSFGPPGFNNMGMGMGAYGYGGLPVNGMQNLPYMQQEQVNSRRGRQR